MKKTLLTSIISVFLIFQLQAQTLSWEGNTENKWFFDELNWKTADNGSVPNNTINPNCLIGNDLLIENSSDLNPIRVTRREL